MLMSGTVIAQIINFALSFALSRLYEPTEFGHYSIFMGLAGVLGAVSTGALDRVILLAGSEDESRRASTAALALALAFASAVALSGIIIGLANIKSVLSLPAADLVVFVPLFMVSYAGAQVFTYSCLRHDQIKKLATLKVVQSILAGSVQLLASNLKSLPGLIVGNVAGWSVLLLAGLRWRVSRGYLRTDMKIGAITSTVRRNWQYPRYVMPNEALDSLSNQAPVFIIGTLLSLSDAGHYGLAIMMLSAPAAVVGQAVGQAFLQYMGRHGNDHRLLTWTMYRIWGGMAIVGVIPFGAILAFGPEIFQLAFGKAWVTAGMVAQTLSVLLFFRFISSPTSTIYLKLKMQREQWWFCVAAAMYRTLAYGLGAVGISFNTMILVHVAIETIAIVVYNLVALRRLRTPPIGSSLEPA